MSYGPLSQRPIGKTIVSSAARTTTGNSSDLDNTAQSLPMFPASLNMYLSVTAVSGSSPTLDVTLEHAPDGTTYFELLHFTQKTAAGIGQATFCNYTTPAQTAMEDAETASGEIQPGAMAPDHRIVWTIGGSSPSFTFAVFCVSVAAF
jgi:hypothetical protein